MPSRQFSSATEFRLANLQGLRGSSLLSCVVCEPGGGIPGHIVQPTTAVPILISSSRLDGYDDLKIPLPIRFKLL